MTTSKKRLRLKNEKIKGSKCRKTGLDLVSMSLFLNDLF